MLTYREAQKANILGDWRQYSPDHPIPDVPNPSRLMLIARQILYPETAHYREEVEAALKRGDEGVIEDDVNYLNEKRLTTYLDRRNARNEARRRRTPDYEGMFRLFHAFLRDRFANMPGPAGERMRHYWRVLNLLKLDDELVWSCRISDDPGADFSEKDLLAFCDSDDVPDTRRSRAPGMVMERVSELLAEDH